jgi:hypothetical protein
MKIAAVNWSRQFERRDVELPQMWRGVWVPIDPTRQEWSGSTWGRRPAT